MSKLQYSLFEAKNQEIANVFGTKREKKKMKISIQKSTLFGFRIGTCIILDG